MPLPNLHARRSESLLRLQTNSPQLVYYLEAWVYVMEARLSVRKCWFWCVSLSWFENNQRALMAKGKIQNIVVALLTALGVTSHVGACRFGYARLG